MLGGLQSGLGLVVKNKDIIKLCVDSDKKLEEYMKQHTAQCNTVSM
jgi:hypothetical protein